LNKKEESEERDHVLSNQSRPMMTEKERFERAQHSKKREKIIIDDFYVGLTKKSMVNIFTYTEKKRFYLERLAKKKHLVVSRFHQIISINWRSD